MSVFDDDEAFRHGLALFNALYQHEFTRAARRGQWPVVYDDEPVLDDEPASLVEMFEHRKAAG